jgi:ABC-type transport system involved in multi-copper enzyme maturation permease subunit
MIRTIAGKEIISNLLSYKFFVVLLLIVVLVTTSFFIMHRDFRNRLSDYQVIRPRPGDPIALVPPNPLSILAKGLDEAMTRSFEIGVTGVTVRAGQKTGNLIFSFFPAPDFLYVVRVVLSLVALLFGFDQISREKENGTLRLMLANGVSRAKILLGKWLGNFVSLAVPFGLVTLLGIVLLALDPGARFSAEHLGRLGLILVITFIYVAFFLSLGIFISTVTRKAASSLIILLFIWALIVFVIPNLGTLLARQMVDAPSVRALSEKRQQVWTREVLLSIGESRQAGGPTAIDIPGRGGWAGHVATIHEEIDRLEEDYRLRFDRLVRQSKGINRLSPAASLVYAVTDIAGTGICEEMNLKREVIRYKDSIIRQMIAGIASDSPAKGYPAFDYRPRSLGAVFAGGALFDAAWLVFFNILFFALSYVSFIRSDVR